MIRYLRCGMFIMLTMNHISLYAETIPAMMIINSKMDEAYTLNDNRSIMETTWQGVCEALGLPPTDVPGGMWCVTPSGNPVYVQGGEICADGSFQTSFDPGWCKTPLASCPNFSWTLSEDKKTCSRPDFSCWINVNDVSEEKLLAGIAYGESSIKNSYEEMAGIASATLRRRDAARQQTVNSLVNKYKKFTYVIIDGNERFRKIMCAADENGYKLAYKAARNALEGGEDFSNGGCFWDGYDLKTSGSHHPKYISGFKFTDPEHNIFSTNEPPPRKRKTNNGSYDYSYDSTAAHGGSIFWKYNNNFIKAKGVRQCS